MKKYIVFSIVLIIAMTIPFSSGAICDVPSTPSKPSGEAYGTIDAWVTLSIPAVEGATCYEWDISGGNYIIISSEYTNENGPSGTWLQIEPTDCISYIYPLSYSIKVRAQNSCGSSSWSQVKNYNSYCPYW